MKASKDDPVARASAELVAACLAEHDAGERFERHVASVGWQGARKFEASEQSAGKRREKALAKLVALRASRA